MMHTLGWVSALPPSSELTNKSRPDPICLPATSRSLQPCPRSRCFQLVLCQNFLCNLAFSSSVSAFPTTYIACSRATYTPPPIVTLNALLATTWSLVRALSSLIVSATQYSSLDQSYHMFVALVHRPFDMNREPSTKDSCDQPSL